MSQVTTGCEDAGSDDIRATARYMAEQLAKGFRAHDKGLRKEAEESFAAVDIIQFDHLEEWEARHAAKAYVGALWAKDDLELEYYSDGQLQTDELAEADWGPVRSKFRERAAVAGMDLRYAEESTEAWRKHKIGGDYWTRFLEAQTYELRAALQDPEFPRKPRYGQSGYGPEPVRYVLGVELHDMNTDASWKQVHRALEPYYLRILRERNDE